MKARPAHAVPPKLGNASAARDAVLRARPGGTTEALGNRLAPHKLKPAALHTLGRTLLGHPGTSPFIKTTTATRIDVRLKKKLPYELDGGARPGRKRLRFRVHPGAITVCVPKGLSTGEGASPARGS
jgi:diacylglycerol kinase family enzyme